MAFVRPSLVVDSTTTSGTGTYTLTDPAAPGGGFRTLADAVADGDVSASDTISYFVVDTTSEGAGLTWEHGVGTVGVGGLTLARTTIIESSNGDAAVSWPSGGSRTVRFGAGTSGFAQLAAAQTFTAAQTFSALITGSAGARITNSATTGLQLYHSGIRRAEILTNTTGNVSLRLNRYQVDGSTIDGALDIANGVVNVTSGTLQQGGTAVALQGVLNAPSGMRLLSLWTTVPTGWSIVASTNDKTILTTETAGDASTTGGTWTISGLTGSTTVDNATVTVNNATLTTLMNGGTGGGTSPVDQVTHGHTTAAHNHTASTTVSAGSSWRPAWIRALVIVKS